MIYVFDELMFYMLIERWLVMFLFGIISVCIYELIVFLESYIIKYYIVICSFFCFRFEFCFLGDLYFLLEYIWYIYICIK